MNTNQKLAKSRIGLYVMSAVGLTLLAIGVGLLVSMALYLVNGQANLGTSLLVSIVVVSMVTSIIAWRKQQTKSE